MTKSIQNWFWCTAQVVYIVFLKYMLGKIFVYPGNKASDKVRLVSPLVIIKVYINSLSILQKHNAIFFKKIRINATKKRRKRNLQFLLWRIKNRCGIFVFTLLLLQAIYEKGRIWERRWGGAVYEKVYKDHWPPSPLEECRQRGFFLMSLWAAATSCSTRLRATSRV